MRRTPLDKRGAGLLSALFLAVALALSIYLLTRAGNNSPEDRDTAAGCTLGDLQRQQALLRPVPHSFYSIDALNPDVVAYAGKYLMYFSGNSLPSTMQPRWATGLAISSNPMGPFQIDPRFRGDYLNGGTTEWRGRLWHLVEVVQGASSELAESSDGRVWRRVAWLPSFRLDGAVVDGADFSLSVERGELVASMFLVRPKPLYSAFTLARVRFDGRRWHGFETILRRNTRTSYEAYDVGEPDVFETASGQRAMLYAATAADHARSIAMAVRARGRWIRCADNPVIRPGATFARVTAVDPSVLRVGRLTYVYYGGATKPGLGSDLGGEIGVARYSAAP